MVGCAVDNDAGASRELNAAQADYYRRELSGLRAQAEAELARRYIELQQLQGSGLMARAVDVRRIIGALEQEITTLERLGTGLDRWL